MLLCRLVIFSKFFQEHHQSVKQFGSVAEEAGLSLTVTDFENRFALDTAHI